MLSFNVALRLVLHGLASKGSGFDAPELELLVLGMCHRGTRSPGIP